MERGQCAGDRNDVSRETIVISDCFSRNDSSFSAADPPRSASRCHSEEPATKNLCASFYGRSYSRRIHGDDQTGHPSDPLFLTFGRTCHENCFPTRTTACPFQCEDSSLTLRMTSWRRNEMCSGRFFGRMFHVKQKCRRRRTSMFNPDGFCPHDPVCKRI